MQEVITYVLFLVSWSPDQSGVDRIERQPSLFASFDDCQRRAQAQAAQLQSEGKGTADNSPKSYHCVAELPNEPGRTWNDLIAILEAERIKQQ